MTSGEGGSSAQIMSPRTLLTFGVVAALVVIALDQVTKAIALDVLWDPARFIEVTGFFNLVMVWNRGVSFGMFSNDSSLGPIILSGLAIVISAFLVWLFRKAESPLVAIAVGFVVGGALGNVVDRLRFGAVADFLDFHAFGYHWPAFNVADSAIFIGVALLVYDGLFAGNKNTT